MSVGRVAGRNRSENACDKKSSDNDNNSAIQNSAAAVQRWFAEHVSVNGEAYTLDIDQSRAVADEHKNTLVTARAGSGKTRVIVAKVAYLVAKQNIPLDEIVVFMFNRAAAAEVNQRIGEVKVDGLSLTAVSSCASTFHKFALDLAKSAGDRPQILSESERDVLIRQSFASAFETTLKSAAPEIPAKLSPAERRELLQIASGFIARAGQKYPGHENLGQLHRDIQKSLENVNDAKIHFYHELSYHAYANYLAALTPPRSDFNLLMSRAAENLRHASLPKNTVEGIARICNLKYLLIDEYQDFSYLFFALTTALRRLAPAAKLFAVGDDWQAINRFAGSDVDYFLRFADYFPEDSANIPLATNYRSARRIVDRANRYMLTHYDSHALPAVAFNRARGKIKVKNPAKLRFDPTDITEDALGDGRFQLALARALGPAASSKNAIRRSAANIPIGAAKLLKQVYRIARRHRRSDIMLLHRHNFTTFAGITLEVFAHALRELLINDRIMPAADFDRQVRSLTIHKSKGLESSVVILLELDREIVHAQHPHAAIFSIFSDSRATELADQQRLLYVAMTRAKQYLYILTRDRKPQFSIQYSTKSSLSS